MRTNSNARRWGGFWWASARTIFCQSLGKNVGLAKLQSFILGAMLAAVPGALYAHYVSSWKKQFNPQITQIRLIIKQIQTSPVHQFGDARRANNPLFNLR